MLAERVIVFNPAYAEQVRGWNPRTISAPTWFDPAITRPVWTADDPFAVVWVGRLEIPKDPQLAVRAFADLALDAPRRAVDARDHRFRRAPTGARAADRRPAAAVADRITLGAGSRPRRSRRRASRSGVFLMTSHAGYEGFPRVLVEAMATGLPAVVTEGSDTGGLVQQGVSGFVRGRDPGRSPTRSGTPAGLDRTKVVDAVAG